MITSTGSRQVKNLALLMKKAKERKKQGLFAVEGRKMFAEVPRDWLKQIYVSETFWKENETLLLGENYEILSDAVFKSVSDTRTPQGILCLVKMPEYQMEQLLLEEHPRLLILESVQDPGNLGTMLRTGESAGISGVIMNQATADLFSPKTIRSTMGSIFRVPFYITKDLCRTILEIKKRGIRVYAAHLKGTIVYDEPDYTKASAFLIGNEGSGLSEEIAELADVCIKIPMSGQTESLNAAVSAALIMYEADRQRRHSR